MRTIGVMINKAVLFLMVCSLCGDGSFAGGGDGGGVFGHDAAFEAGFGRAPGGEAGGDLGFGDVEGEGAGGDIDDDGVALVDGGDGPAEEGFGGDVAGHESAGGPGEAAIC